MIALTAGCAPQKYNIEKSSCPELGTCTFEIFKDKSLIIEQGVTGKLQYTLTEAAGKNVALYTYSKTTSGRHQDNFYSEEVVFEYTGKKIDTTTINKNSLLFGVSCYCKGKAGHYSFKSSSVTSNGKGVSVTLPDVIENQQLKRFTIK